MAIEETIDKAIAELIGQLTSADASEAARIYDRIKELESLKKERITT